MIGGIRKSSKVWRPVVIAQVLDADDAEVRQPVMVRTKRDQIGEVVSTTLRPRRDMMDISRQVKAAYNAAILVADSGLFLLILKATTKPSTILVGGE